MLEIKGYRVVEQLNQGKHFNVYRSIRLSDEKSVILKACRFEQPSMQELATLQHEYNLLKQLDSAKLIKAYDLFKYKHQLVLELEDINGYSLKQYLSENSLDLGDFLNLAIQIVEALQDLHANNIIHKDINPSNIIIAPGTLTAQLIDLSISSQLTQETQALTPEHLEGTLPYLSPEQTGRMNCLVDYRADFYSLGVTFYEMLAGVVPFQNNDPLELVYCHLAKTPSPLVEINPQCPSMVAEIITKLMSKLPEGRYASVAGLKTDLIKCQQQWLAHKKIDTFALAQADYSEQLHLSQRLYGRETAIQQLISAFARACEGKPELALVAGYSGIGKTSLVKEIYKPITQKQGYFLAGKFDQLQRTTPYSAIIEAFQDLAHRLLTLPKPELKDLKENLLSALGNNGQVIIDVFPVVELIIGEQSPVDELPPEQAQSRFILTFQNFVRVLATPAHPLVLFLDDLQWADSASLQLIDQFMTDAKLQHFLMIGAYRDNEVSGDHPLMMLLQSLKKAEINIDTILLEPLSKSAIRQFLADSFNSTVDYVESLTELTFEKTQGNPFFINEFIKMLYQQRIIKFNIEQHQWDWDISQIDKMAVTHNVIDLLLQRMHDLPQEVQRIISLASCMGHIFDLQSLSIISEQSLSTTAHQLWPLIKARFIKPLRDDYKLAQALAETTLESTNLTEKVVYQFVHDRIQQAAYELISEEIKQQTHLNIGRLLLQEETLHAEHKRLFEILNQFNHSLDLIKDKTERLSLAQYNLWAGKKAQQSNAYQSAVSYLNAGICLLAEEPWQSHYELVFSLYKTLAECSFLLEDYQTAESATQLLLAKARNLIDKAEIYNIMIAMLHAKNNQIDALALSLTALRSLGMKMPQKPKPIHIIAAIFTVKRQIGKRNIAELDLKPMSDPHYLMIDRLLVQLVNIAYILDQNLYVLLTLKAISLYLKQGYTNNSSFMLLGHAILSMHSLNRYQDALAFLALSSRLSKLTPTNTTAAARAQFALGGFVLPFKDPLITCLDYVKRGYQLCLETGDLAYALYCIMQISLISFAVGKPLAEVELAVRNVFAYKSKMSSPEFENTMKAFDDLVHALLSSEFPVQPRLANPKNAHNTDVCFIYSFYIMYNYLAEDYHQALEDCQANEPYVIFMSSEVNQPLNQYFYALTLVACYPQANQKQQVKYLKKLKKLIAEVKKWASWCPANYAHWYLLLSAEQARITRQIETAMNLYDQAIQAAYEQQAIHVIAIANECAARFYLGLDKPHIAKLYLNAAHYAYGQWGAIAKCKLIEKKYPELLEAPEAHVKEELTTTNSLGGSFITSTTSLASIDMLSILKSAQTISSEIQLDKLLQKLLYILLENAGAERGLLLMYQNNTWLVKAEGTISEQRVTLTQAEGIENRNDIPLSVIQYVEHSGQQLLLQTAADFERYAENDKYIEAIKPQSILVLPVHYQNELICLFYLENRTISCAFSSEQIQTLNLLASQAAISLTNAQLYYQATHDPLTGLANRILLQQLFEFYAKRAKRNKEKIAVLFLDLDGFKKINDTLGHDIGDKVLQHFATVLKTTLRESDLAVRLGGDEFVAVLDGFTDLDQVQAIAQRLLQSLMEPITILGHAITIGTSIGISLYPEHGDTIQQLLKLADTALYQVKAKGKGHYLFYQPAMDKAIGE